MYKNIKLSVLIIPLVILLTFPAIVTAGSQPNGKPFQALRATDAYLQNQIDLMQDQINEIIDDASSLEARVAANEQFIADLIAEDEAIRDRLAELADLIDDNANKLDQHSAEIAELRTALATNNAKITYLEGQVVDINTTLQTKQDILNGQCPIGYYLRDIDPDGAITCGMDMMGSDGLTKTIVSHYSTVAAQYDECTESWPLIGCVAWTTHYPAYSKYNYCPSGYTLTGGGFDYNHNGRDIALDISKPSGSAWYVVINNYGTVSHAVSSYAVCVKVTP